MHLTRIVIVDDFLAKLRPCDIPLGFTYGAEEPANLTADIRQLVTVRLQSALAVRTVEAVDFLDCYIYHSHYRRS